MTLAAAGVKRRYTVAIIKGAAPIEELRALLQIWQPGDDPLELQRRVSESDLLGKQTARRARDMVKEVFRPRLLTPDDRAARWLKRFLEAGGEPQAFRELLFLYEARAEAILYDFVLLVFWPACRSGALVLAVDDVLSFFDNAVQSGHIERPWAQQSALRTASAILASLRGFGFLRLDQRGQREIVRYRVSDAAVAYLAHDLHLSGLPDADVVEHPDWGLFGLDRENVLDRLDALGPGAGLVVQRAGSVVRITWSHQSMESLIDAIK